jgi:hypothetical protein
LNDKRLPRALPTDTPPLRGDKHRRAADCINDVKRGVSNFPFIFVARVTPDQRGVVVMRKDQPLLITWYLYFVFVFLHLLSLSLKLASARPSANF